MNAPVQKAIVLFAHGSRDPFWHRPIQAVASCIYANNPGAMVECAYLELSTPDLHTVCGQFIATGVNVISIIPMFLGVGKHAREDLPVLVQQLREQFSSVQFLLQPAIGEDPRLIQLLAHIATESLNPETP